jgi:hypothetical protein
MQARVLSVQVAQDKVEEVEDAYHASFKGRSPRPCHATIAPYSHAGQRASP